MEAIKRIFKFGLGTAFGAAVGGGIGALMAPQRGEDLQAEARALIDDVKTEGEAARIATEESLARRFRQQVDDSVALTPKTEHQPPKSV